MSGHVPKKKRTTWHDRRCHHGNEPVIRITYDFIHCERPECWEEVLAHSGFLQSTPLRIAAPDLLEAAKETAKHPCFDFPGGGGCPAHDGTGLWCASCLARAAITKAKGR